MKINSAVTKRLSDILRQRNMSFYRLSDILRQRNMSFYRLEKITLIPHNTMKTLMFDAPIFEHDDLEIE